MIVQICIQNILVVTWYNSWFQTFNHMTIHIFKLGELTNDDQAAGINIIHTMFCAGTRLERCHNVKEHFHSIVIQRFHKVPDTLTYRIWNRWPWKVNNRRNFTGDLDSLWSIQSFLEKVPYSYGIIFQVKNQVRIFDLKNLSLVFYLNIFHIRTRVRRIVFLTDNFVCILKTS